MQIFDSVKRFVRERGGSLSSMMGLVFLVLIGAAGGAVDLSNAMRERAIAQHDLDASLISALRNEDTEDMTPEERTEVVRKYIARTYGKLPPEARLTVIKDGDTYDATLDFEADTTLLGVVGYDSLPVTVASSVTFGPPRPMELALVLDTTHSMGFDGKMDAMKAAANDLVEVLTEEGTVRVALVPFSRYVNVGLPNRNAAGLDIPDDEPDRQQCTTTPDTREVNCRNEPDTCSNESCSTYTDTCTSDGRNYSCEKQDCRTTSTYACTRNVCDREETGTSTTQCNIEVGNKWRGCVGSREAPHNISPTPSGGPVPGFLEGDCAHPIMRLTTDGTALMNAITQFTPQGETYIAPALLWGARLISPDAPFPDGTPDTADPSIYKVIVLMSDGANTVSKIPGEILHTGDDRTASDDQLRQICDGIKARGTTIFTVAYDIEDADGRALLSDCASGGGQKFFDARNASELAESFESIARGFRRVRVSQ